MGAVLWRPSASLLSGNISCFIALPPAQLDSKLTTAYRLPFTKSPLQLYNLRRRTRADCAPTSLQTFRSNTIRPREE